MEIPQHIRFCGMEKDYGDADWIVFGAPFDGTASFRAGSRFAPAAMRRDSWALESYSPYQDKDLLDLAICDAGDLDLPFGNPARVLAIIEEYVSTLIATGKHPVMLGGEHLLSLGVVSALVSQYNDLHIVHLDAHTDLRAEFIGERLSHANVIQLIYEKTGRGRIHSFGIRSGLQEEFEFAREFMDFHPFDLEGMGGLQDKVGDSPVYLTIDLDVLDPAYMPGTGTPEPGGVSFRELLSGLWHLEGLNIVGADIMELAPNLDPSGISTAAAVKLLREMLLLICR